MRKSDLCQYIFAGKAIELFYSANKNTGGFDVSTYLPDEKKGLSWTYSPLSNRTLFTSF